MDRESGLQKSEKEEFMEHAEEIVARAEGGESWFQTALGKCFLFGWSMEQDDGKAYQWFKKAAEQGNEIAKMYQGHCFLYGIGTEKDEGQGYRMLDAALNYNYPGSGQSQRQSEDSAFRNDDLCQLFLDLGDALENSLGVIRNYRVAVYYFNMLSEWGQPVGAERMSHYRKKLLGWKKID